RGVQTSCGGAWRRRVRTVWLSVVRVSLVMVRPSLAGLLYASQVLLESVHPLLPDRAESLGPGPRVHHIGESGPLLEPLRTFFMVIDRRAGSSSAPHQTGALAAVPRNRQHPSPRASPQLRSLP